MSDKKKKIIHVDNLIIHAKKVEIIDDSREDAKVEVKEDLIARRDPWDSFGEDSKGISNMNNQKRLKIPLTIKKKYE